MAVKVKVRIGTLCITLLIMMCMFVLVDGINHITVQAASGLVENDSNVIMTANNISLQFFYNGTGWFIV